MVFCSIMEERVCPQCHDPVPIDAKWCENCGKVLKPILVGVISIGYGMVLGALFSPYFWIAGFAIGLILLIKPDRLNGIVIISLNITFGVAGFLISFIFK